MRRREFIALVGSATLWSLAARAQQSERVRRVGVLMPFITGDAEADARKAALEQTLDESGWTVGRNLQIDYRLAGGTADPIRRSAAELIALSPDVIVTIGSLTVAISRIRSAPASCRALHDPAATLPGSLISITA